MEKTRKIKNQQKNKNSQRKEELSCFELSLINEKNWFWIHEKN